MNSSIKNELYLIILDIDHFKSINDTFRHVEGDKSIIVIAKILTTVFTSTNAFLSRHGGDEYTFIIGTDETMVLSYLKNIDEALLSLLTNL